jgi:hypothetical protein
VSALLLVGLLLLSAGFIGLAYWLAERYDPEGLGSVTAETKRRIR